MLHYFTNGIDTGKSAYPIIFKHIYLYQVSIPFQSIRIMLLPYIYVAIVHVIVLIWEGVYVLSSETFYDYFAFDMLQGGKQQFDFIVGYLFKFLSAALSLYFCVVVYSFYDSLD